MKLVIKVTDDEYEMLKAYAAAKRKYEVGKGFVVDKAIEEMVSIGLDGISETIILDETGNPIQWNTFFNRHIQQVKRQIYKKY